jgi:hypothetical protein
VQEGWIGDVAGTEADPREVVVRVDWFVGVMADR